MESEGILMYSDSVCWEIGEGALGHKQKAPSVSPHHRLSSPPVIHGGRLGSEGLTAMAHLEPPDPYELQKMITFSSRTDGSHMEKVFLSSAVCQLFEWRELACPDRLAKVRGTSL
ncbi:hypothetical protein SRHO_G00202290 [Serrasalmus rhombeus]